MPKSSKNDKGASVGIGREPLEDGRTDIVQGELGELGILSCDRHNPKETCEKLNLP